VEKVKALNRKSKDIGQKKSSTKHASKPAPAGLARTKHTVPQPFALATEKRASLGMRPSGEPDITNGLNKSFKANNALRPNPIKQNQVSAATRHKYLIIVNLAMCLFYNNNNNIVSACEVEL
jgi:hypothetical protein